MSNKIEVVVFKQEHLEKIKVKKEYDPGEVPKTVMNSAFTFMRGDTVVAIFGGFLFVPGVIHFWGLTSDEARRTPLDFHKTVLKVLRWYEQHEKPRRIQIDVRANYGEGCKWAESIGFKREGLMKSWGTDGGDFYLYGKAC